MELEHSKYDVSPVTGQNKTFGIFFLSDFCFNPSQVSQEYSVVHCYSVKNHDNNKSDKKPVMFIDSSLNVTYNVSS